MSYFILIIAIFILVGAQNGFVSQISVFGGVINLVVLTLVSLFYLKFEKFALIVSIVLALFVDFYNYSYFMLSLAPVILVFVILLFIKNKVSEEGNYLFVVLSVFSASVVFDLFTISDKHISGTGSFWLLVGEYVLPNALLNLIIAVPFYIAVGYIMKVLEMYQIVKKQESKIEV